jgi:hypothetical protein
MREQRGQSVSREVDVGSPGRGEIERIGIQAKKKRG